MAGQPLPVKVRPGTYRVVVLPSECGTSRYAAEAITVDAPPAAADEKVVVACLTEASNFGRCRSWWLVRP